MPERLYFRWIEHPATRRILGALLLGILIFLILWGRGQWSLNQILDRGLTGLHQRQLAVWKNEFSAATLHFKELSAFVIQEIHSNPEIASTMARLIDSATEDEREAARAHLHALTGPYHQRIAKNGIKQLHFHSPQSDSLLRLHRPDRFGDSLLGIRPTVERANALQKPVSGFEEGRIYNGFRYVFPLFDGTRHVGSVETSFHADAVTGFMRKVYDKRQHLFLMRREVVERKVFGDLQSQYAASQYDPDFLVERRPDGSVPSLHQDLPEVMQKHILKPLAENLRQMLPETSEGAALFNAGDRWWMLYHQPVFNILDEPVAAIVAMQEVQDPISLYAQHRRNSLLLVGFSFLFAGLGALGFHFWRREQFEKTQTARQLSLLARQIPGMIYQYRLWPDSGRSSMPYASEGLRQLFGLDPESVSEDASALNEVIHPGDRKWVQESVQRSAANL
jgi:hypothetical protein